MNCISCNAPIRPEFVHSIRSNICPACGEKMMSDASREFLDEIRDAFNKMPNDPEGLAGWLLSHYEVRKVGTGEPVQEFYNGKKLSKKRIVEVDEESDDGEPKLKIAPNRLQEFKRRAGVKHQGGKTAKQLAMLASQINGDDEFEEDSSVDDYEDPEFTQAALRAMDKSNANNVGEYDKEQLRLMMKAKKAYKSTPQFDDGNESNLEGLHPALHDDRLNRLQKQEDLSFGGSVGIIKRSG